jgi:hypothetical protein
MRHTPLTTEDSRVKAASVCSRCNKWREQRRLKMDPDALTLASGEPARVCKRCYPVIVTVTLSSVLGTVDVLLDDFNALPAPYQTLGRLRSLLASTFRMPVGTAWSVVEHHTDETGSRRTCLASSTLLSAVGHKDHKRVMSCLHARVPLWSLNPPHIYVALRQCLTEEEMGDVMSSYLGS